VPSILLRSLRDQQKGLLWWFLGIFALMLVTVLLYPSVGAAPEMEALFEDMPPAIQVFVGEIGDITSPEGYLNSQLFALMVPLLFMIYCIGQGSGAIAGEEAAGTMDLLLANPVTRTQVVLEKFGAMLAGGMVLGFSTVFGLVVGVLIVDMDISIGRMSEATLASLLVGYLFGGIALLLGCWTGRRSLSIGVSVGIGVFSYLLNGFALVITWLEPYRILSPFHYATNNDPLSNGLDLSDTLVLIAITAVLVLGAVMTFERRDVQK
jgi:ABC-2 type transport system permease protein